MLLYEELSNEVIGAAMTVHRILGPGLLENAYESALRIELELRGLSAKCQHPFKLMYKGRDTGIYFADLIVENKIIVELKSVVSFTNVMEAQLLNYLRLSGIRIGYLMNFRNLELDWKRRVI